MRDYKETGAHHRGVVRQTLAGGDAAVGSALGFVVRYFEVAAGGFTSLERHEHPHAVVVLRGRGHVILDGHAHEIAPFDSVYVAPHALHQFHAGLGEPLGFLCIVDRERDRPRVATPEEIAELRQDPAVAALLARMLG